MKFKFDEYYSRHFPLSLIGKENQKRLNRFKVLIAGLGGLGTVTAELLVALGVGEVSLVDYDIIEQSNLPRQRLYDFIDINKTKVEVARETLIKRNPDTKIRIFPASIDGNSVNELLDGIEMVFDCLDSFASRRPLHSVCQERKIPYIFAGAINQSANVMAFDFSKDSPCLICVMGNPVDSLENSCEIQGIHPAILNIASSIQITEGIKILLGQESKNKNKMVFVDLEDIEIEKIEFKRRENCRSCAFIEDLEEKGQAGETRVNTHPTDFGGIKITSLCGRDTHLVDGFKLPGDFISIKNKLSEKWEIESLGDTAVSFSLGGIKCTLISTGIINIKEAGSKANVITVFLKLMNYLNS